MNQSATIQTDPKHYEPEIASSGDNLSHRKPMDTRHSSASSQSFSRQTASQSPDTPSHPAPASIGSRVSTREESSNKERNPLSPTPVESNRGHYVQAGEMGPLWQSEQRLRQIIEGKDAEIRDLQAKNAQTVQQYDTHLKNMQATCTEYIQQRDVWIAQLGKDNKNLERSLKRLNGECSRLQSIALTAQEGALRAMEQGGWAAKEDRVVRDELVKLQDGLRSWAREYSKVVVKSDLERVSMRQKDKVVEELKGYCVQTNWGSLLERMPISLNKVPPILVQALLAKDIFQTIFADPFFAFPETFDDPKLPNRDEMQLLYQTMTQLNNQEAQVWRSQIIRVLSAYQSGGKGSLMPDRLQRMASSHAKDLINGPAHVFLRKPASQAAVVKRSNDLYRLYHQAGELAWSLWAQRTVIASHDQQNLHEFSSSSSLMAAHRLHHLDEDDKRLDGRKTLLCIQPAVLAFGNENGEHYDKSKVWAKAIVLVEDDA